MALAHSSTVAMMPRSATHRAQGELLEQPTESYGARSEGRVELLLAQPAGLHPRCVAMAVEEGQLRRRLSPGRGGSVRSIVMQPNRESVLKCPSAPEPHRGRSSSAL